MTLRFGASPAGSGCRAPSPDDAKVSALRAFILTPPRSAYPLVPCNDSPVDGGYRSG
jgi:hypothetical protein